jgi:hypothetical protein
MKGLYWKALVQASQENLDGQMLPMVAGKIGMI